MSKHSGTRGHFNKMSLKTTHIHHVSEFGQLENVTAVFILTCSGTVDLTM